MVYVTKEDPKDNGWTTQKSGVAVAIHSAEGDVTRQRTVEKKDNRVVTGHLQSPTVIDDGRLVSE